jgi:hypothetical protein
LLISIPLNFARRSDAKAFGDLLLKEEPATPSNSRLSLTQRIEEIEKTTKVVYLNKKYSNARCSKNIQRNRYKFSTRGWFLLTG